MPSFKSNIIEVCIFSIVKKSTKYLLLRRSKSEKIYPDTWQIISGRIEKNETALQASLREMIEETSLRPKKFWVCPHSNVFLNPIKNEIHATSVFVAEVSDGINPKLSAEHYQFKWCSFAEAKKLLVWPGQINVIKISNDYIVKRGETSRWAEIPISTYKKFLKG